MISTPLGINVQATGGALGGGITLEGGSGADTYTVTNTRASEPIILTGNNAGGNTFDILGTSSLVTVNAGTGTGNLVNLGDSTHAASALGNVTVAGSTGLPIDDSADSTANQTGDVTNSAVTIGTGPVCTDSGATLGALTIHTGTTAANTVTVAGTPGSAALTLDMGTSTTNAIDLGNGSVSTLGSVTINGTTGLTGDDSADSTVGLSIAVSSTSITMGSAPIFTYGTASLTSLTIDGGIGGDTWTVGGTPLNALITLNTAPGNGATDAVTLGGGSGASALGDVTVNAGGAGATDLTVDDSGGPSAATIGVTSAAISYTSGSIFAYSGSGLAALTLDTSNLGGTTVNITGTPAGLTNGFLLDTGTGGTDTVNIGDSSHVASGVGSPAIQSEGSAIDLTIDDSADLASSQTVHISSSQVKFGTSGPTFDYTFATFTALTFDASNQGSNTVDVANSPAASSGYAPMTLAMGTGTGNSVHVGNRADSVGNVTVTTGVGGTTGLTIDDSNGSGSWVYNVTVTSVSFGGGPTYTYGGASLSSLDLKITNNGGNTVNVTGTPSLPLGSALSVSTFSGTGDAVTLGDATHAASGLESVSIGSGGGAPLAVTINDSAGPGGASIGIAPSVSFGAIGPRFDLSGATLNSLTLDASTSGTTTVSVTGSPSGASVLAPITLTMGSGSGNAVDLSDSTHAAIGLGDVNLTTTFPGQIALAIDDSADTNGQNVTMSYSDLKFGTSGPDFSYSPTVVALSGLTFDASDQGLNTVNVGSSPLGAPVTLNMGSGTNNAITLGGSTYAADILNGNFTITTGGTAPNLGSTSLDIDDSQDTTGQVVGVTAMDVSLNGLTFNYCGALLSALIFNAGSGGDTVDVTGSPAAVSGLAPITLAMGSSTNNAVNLGSPSSAASGLGSVTVTGTTNLTIDDSADTSSRSPLLQYNSTTDLSELTGVSASTLAFGSGVAHVSLLASSNPSVATSLTVDFSQGNPLPAGASTSFDFDATPGASNSLILQGELNGSTPFDSESYSPTSGQPGAGVISLTVGSATSILNFGGLTPITDTVPVTSYTFLAPSNAQVVNVTNGPTVGTLKTDTISSGDTPSAFELVNFANKSDVLVDLSGIADPTYIQPPSTPATGLNNLTLKYFGNSTTGHTLNVNGTTAGSVTTILLGGTGNTVAVNSVTPGGPLVIDDVPGSSGGVNSVSIGNNGSLASIGASVTINGPSKSTDVPVDGSADTSPFGSMVLDLNVAGTMADLTGLLPGGPLVYDPVGIHSLSVSTGTGSDQLTVDFHNGNPFLGSGLGSPPPTPYTLQYNGGGGGDSLTFRDSSATANPDFVSEDYMASGPGAGTVNFYNGTLKVPVFQGGVQFSQLTPVIDSTPVTSYTFTPPASGGTISVTDAPTSGYTLISDPSPSPSFESVAFSNKTDVTIDATPVSRNNLIVLNNPTPAAGEQMLTVELGSGNDTVNIAHNPGPNVGLVIVGGVGSQTVSVNGAGLATGTGSANFGILGGAGPNTLLLNDQGVGGPLTLQPGTPTSPAIALFGSSYSMSFANFGTIQGFETNNAPTFVTTSPVPTIPTQPGLPLNDIPVATFTDPDLIENASSFQATINWGDNSAPTTGTITADPSTPGRYIISGSHTYTVTGNDTIGVTLTALGGTFHSNLDNAGGAVVPVSTQLVAIPAVSGSTATASVVDFQLASTTAMPATAGTPASGTLAVFSNTNGSPSPGAYYALINWGDGTGLTGATIVTDSSTAGEFDIIGTHVYAAPGTYAGTIELYGMGTGQSLSIPLSATVQAPTVAVATGLTATGGVPTGNLTVATVSVPVFQGSPGLDPTGYTASVDYGDGSPTVPVTLAATSLPGATGFHVLTSGHTYAAGGSYTLSVTIRDGFGVIVGTGTAAVSVSTPVTPTPPTPPGPPAPVLSWGRLSPQSDSGVSDSDGITKVNTPTFVGGATPGSVIQVFETPTGSSAAPVLIASGVADNAGSWSASVVGAPLADGSYQIMAKATDSGGNASKSLGTIVIDTVSPVITNVVFRRLRGEMDFYFQDNLSGVFLAGLSNGANYQLSANPLNNYTPVRKVIIPTRVSVIPGATPTSVDEAAVIFNHSKPLNPGHYNIQVLAAGITDIAGNMLSGRFYGSYPTGHAQPGGNYVGQITAFPNKVLGAFPFKTGYAKPKPVPSSRSLARVEALAGARPAHVMQAGSPMNRPNQGHAEHSVEPRGPRRWLGWTLPAAARISF